MRVYLHEGISEAAEALERGPKDHAVSGVLPCRQ